MSDNVEGFQNDVVLSSEVYNPIHGLKQKFAAMGEDELRAVLNPHMKIARVVKRDDGWHVLSESGKNLGGPYSSKEEADKRLGQVEYFKHKGGAVDTRQPPRSKNPRICPSCGEDQEMVKLRGGIEHQPDSCPMNKKASIEVLAKDPLFKSRLIWALVDLHAAYRGDWNLICKMLVARFPKYEKEIMRFLANVSRNVESIHVLSELSKKASNVKLLELVQTLDKVAAAGGLMEKKAIEEYMTMVAAGELEDPIGVGQVLLTQFKMADGEEGGGLWEDVKGLASDLWSAITGAVSQLDEMTASVEQYLAAVEGGGAQAQAVAARAKKDPLDAQIEQAWYQLASGVQVNIMDIPKIFADVRAAVQNGQTVEEGVQAAIAKYQQNKTASGSCVKCYHKLRQLSDGSLLCDDPDCECMCDTEERKVAAAGDPQSVVPAQDMDLNEAMAALAQLAKATAFRNERIAELDKEIEEKYQISQLQTKAPIAEQRVKKGLDELKTAQRKFEGVLFRLKEVTHRRQFQPKMFMELIRGLFKGNDEVQVKINELESQATRPQSKSKELEVVVQDTDPVSEEAPAEKKEAPAKEPAEKK